MTYLEYDLRVLKVLFGLLLRRMCPKKLVCHNNKYRPRQYPKYIQKLLTRKAAMRRKLMTVGSPEFKEKYRKIAI